MRIGIDARLYTQTGVGRYLRNLIEELSLIDKKNEYFIYLRKKEGKEFIPPNKNWQKKILDIPWHTFSEQLIVPSCLLRDNLDIAHFPYFNIPFFYRRPYLLTIHDLIVDHFNTGKASTLPKIFYKGKRWGYYLITSSGIKRAKKIAVISHTTKREVIEHYQVSPQKIIVTYDALDNHFVKVVNENRPKRYFQEDYLLYVGNAYPHKNLERLFQAIKIVIKERKVKLVLAGDDNYFYPRLKKLAKDLGLSEVIIFFGEANDEQLFNLYTFSRALIFPSLMEGFGLPNLEAVFCGCLPVVSDIPAFREIWGESLYYFNPYDLKEIARKIFQVLNLPFFQYQRKVKEAQKKLQKFSWRKTAKMTLATYKEIYQSVDFRGKILHF